MNIMNKRPINFAKGHQVPFAYFVFFYTVVDANDENNDFG